MLAVPTPQTPGTIQNADAVQVEGLSPKYWTGLDSLIFGPSDFGSFTENVADGSICTIVYFAFHGTVFLPMLRIVTAATGCFMTFEKV